MKKMLLLMISLVFVLAACGGEKPNSKVKTAKKEDCEAGGLILDNDEDPDWEIDLDGDCEGDIEYEGNEKKTIHKTTDRNGVINNVTNSVTPKTNTSVKVKKPTSQSKINISKPESKPTRSFQSNNSRNSVPTKSTPRRSR